MGATATRCAADQRGLVRGLGARRGPSASERPRRPRALVGPGGRRCRGTGPRARAAPARGPRPPGGPWPRAPRRRVRAVRDRLALGSRPGRPGRRARPELLQALAQPGSADAAAEPGPASRGTRRARRRAASGRVLEQPAARSAGLVGRPGRGELADPARCGPTWRRWPRPRRRRCRRRSPRSAARRPGSGARRQPQTGHASPSDEVAGELCRPCPRSRASRSDRARRSRLRRSTRALTRELGAQAGEPARATVGAARRASGDRTGQRGGRCAWRRRRAAAQPGAAACSSPRRPHGGAHLDLAAQRHGQRVLHRPPTPRARAASTSLAG